MSLGTPYVPDLTPNAQGGVVSNLSATQVQAAYPGQTKTPSASFSITYGGHLLRFTKGVPFVTNPQLTAYLAQHNCPVS
ncbi:hypothetical protein [Aquitalea aquatilis]|uniref:hypothetical protein n=1 Tax=Aquitalea aquatilis TaxID=1537400 RepID=UPI0010BD7AA1|nr:hypothetical protein [Aquitalea aquatilis]